jgi:hypothetical protein
VLVLPWLFLSWITVAQVLAALKLRSSNRYGIYEGDSDAMRWTAAAGYMLLLIVFGGFIVSTI